MLRVNWRNLDLISLRPSLQTVPRRMPILLALSKIQQCPQLWPMKLLNLSKYQVFVTKSVNDLSFRSMKRVFAMLRRNVPFHTNTSVKCMLIRMCVLSQIFYACQVVNFSQEWLRRLHSLQRRCLRWSVSATCSFSCNLAVANMLPISYQLAFIDLVFLNKSLNGTIDFDIRNYVSVIYPPANLRSANVPYFQVRARYNCKNFFDRVCVLANSCHNAGIVIPSPPDSFKRQLKISMTRTLASTFDSGLPPTWNPFST